MALAVAIGGYSLRQMAKNFVAARLEQRSGNSVGGPDVRSSRSTRNWPPSGSAPPFNSPFQGTITRSKPRWRTVLPLAVGRRSGAAAADHRPSDPKLHHRPAGPAIAAGRARLPGERPVVAIAVTEDFTPVRQGIQKLLLELTADRSVAVWSCCCCSSGWSCGAVWRHWSRSAVNCLG
jgi:hypothetical protein